LLTGRVPVDIKRPTGEHVLVSWVRKYYFETIQDQFVYDQREKNNDPEGPN